MPCQYNNACPFILLLCFLLLVLFAVLVEGHGGGGDDVVAVGETIDGDLDEVVHQTKKFISEAVAFMADDQNQFAREMIGI